MEVKAGYTQTELGIIPEDWTVSLLVELATRITDGEHLTPRRSENGYYLLSARNIHNGRIDLKDVDYVGKDEYLRIRQRCNPEPGDVLVSCSGSIGRVAVVPPNIECVMVRSAALIKPNPKCLSGRYAQYSLQSSAGQRQIFASLNQGAQANLFINHIQNLRIAIPPTKTEQEAIAEALSDADALIESLEKLVAKKRQIKQGAMQELLTGKRRLPGFSKEWQLFLVENVVERFFCGPSPTCEERNITDDAEWGVLKTTAITWGAGWDWTKHKVLPKSFWNRPEIELRQGDVIVTKAGPRHRVGVSAWVDFVPKRIVVSGKMIALRPDMGKAVPLMLAAAIAGRDAQEFLDQRTTGMAESQVNFENSVLLRTPIKLPCIEEQRAITGIVSDMDAEISTLESKLTKARQIKQAMMQELLTGRIRLV